MPTIEQLDELLQKEPDDVFLNFGMAMALVKAEQLDAALDRFERTIQLDRDYVAAYFHKARLLLQLEQVERARETLRQGSETAGRIGDEKTRGEIAELFDSIA